MGAPLTLGGFELTERIRRGGMAEVWRGRHLREGEDVAVKLVDVDRAQTRRLREALQNEVRAMARLDHPSVVRVHDYGETGPEIAEASGGAIAAGTPYLVMDLADRGPLVRGHVADWETLRGVLRDVLEALCHAHARGVVHRDIKPSNVLVSGEPARFLLSDFGISSALTYDAKGAPQVPIPAGTAWFMAPEQVLGLHRDEGPWTDLYSLGCLAFLLATGRPPFPGSDRDKIYTAQCLAPPPRLVPRFELPAALEAWMGVCLTKRPRDRFPFAADALAALEEIAGPTLAPRPAPSEAPPRPTSTAPGAPTVDPSSTPTQGNGPETHKDRTETAALLALSGFDVGGDVAPDLREEAQAIRDRCGPRFDAAEPPRAPPRHLLGIGLGVYGLRAVPLAGRDAERQRLWVALEEAWDTRSPRIVELRGRAGYGKTRLAEWLAERAHQSGAARVAWAALGPVPSPGEGLSRMWLRLLRGERLPRPDLRERLAHHPTLGALDRLGVGERVRLLDLLAPRARGRSLDRAEERFAALTPLLRALGERRPVIMVFDDVQVGREAIRLCEHLLKLRRADLPVLAVMTVREEALEERPVESAMLDEVRELDGAERLTLGPLGASAHARLIGSMLGLEDGLASRIAERTGGNPLFAVQLVGDWVQRGVLETGEDGFRVADGADLPLPDDIHQLWNVRVERLLESFPLAERDAVGRALELAALLGRRVDLRELRAACAQAGCALPEGLLDRLASRRLALVGRARLSFVHGLLSESLQRRAREGGRAAALHRACAAALDEIGARSAHERVGRHLAAAGDAEGAAPRLLEGAAARLRACDFAEAHALAQLSEEGLAARVSEGDARRARGWALRAEAAIKQGDVEGCLAHVARAETTVSDEVLAEVARLRARATLKQGDHERAATLFEDALARMRAVGDQPGEGACLHGLGEAERVTGRIAQAVGRFEDAIALFSEEGLPLDEARAQMGLGDTLRRRGELERAIGLIETALETTRRLGNPRGVATCANTLGDIARAQARLDEAEARYAECVEELEALASFEAIIPRINLGFVQLARARWAEARATLEPARDELVSRPGYQVYVLAGLLACAAGEARWDELAPLTDAIEAILDEVPLVDEDLAWCFGIAWERARDAGQSDHARRARDRAVAQYRELGRDAEADALSDR